MLQRHGVMLVAHSAELRKSADQIGAVILKILRIGGDALIDRDVGVYEIVIEKARAGWLVNR